MAFSVSVGESDFADLRKAGSYYVDKTDIIYELIQNTKNKVTLITRPRRFGKTLTMSMMANFFSIRKDSRDIFEGLKICRGAIWLYADFMLWDFFLSEASQSKEIIR